MELIINYGVEFMKFLVTVVLSSTVSLFSFGNVTDVADMTQDQIELCYDQYIYSSEWDGILDVESVPKTFAEHDLLIFVDKLNYYYSKHDYDVEDLEQYLNEHFTDYKFQKSTYKHMWNCLEDKEKDIVTKESWDDRDKLARKRNTVKAYIVKYHENLFVKGGN